MDDIEDDFFRADLFATFHHEAAGHTQSLLVACRSVAAAAESGGAAGDAARIVRDAAHALKGSAATLQLVPLSSAAATLESAALQLLPQATRAALPATPPTAALRALCLSPAPELRAVLHELRSFAAFFAEWLAARGGADAIAPQLAPAEAQALRTANVDNMEAVLAPFSDLGLV